MARGTTSFGMAVTLLGAFVACDGDSHDDGGGAGGSRAARAGAAGSSGAAVSAGSAGVSGGASAGRAGAAGDGASSGAAGGSGAPSPGGAAGGGGVAGASGAAAGSAGAENEAGAPGAAGEGGITGDGGAPGEPVGLSWPIDCIPGQTCVGIGYPDTDDDGDAHDCNDPGYVGHEGTDIRITAQAQADGTAVRAAADGVVVFAFDGKFDRCPDANEPDCQPPSNQDPGSSSGTTVCTPVGPYCGTGQPGCFWCFAGGNVLVVRHEGVPGVFATRYDHLKQDSLLVAPGDTVTRGQKLAEAASSGSSTEPHLHFEVWGTGFYELADPWAGACGPNFGPSLWAYDPPWSG